MSPSRLRPANLVAVLAPFAVLAPAAPVLASPVHAAPVAIEFAAAPAQEDEESATQQSAEEFQIVDAHEIATETVGAREGLESAELHEILRRVRLSEDLIRDFTKRFIRVDRALLDLEFTTERAGDVFAERVAVRDLAAPKDDAWLGHAGLLPTRSSWPVDAADAAIAKGELRMFEAFTSRISHFEHIHFKFVRGDFDDSGQRYTNQVGLGGMAWLTDGRPCGVSAKMEVEWASPEDPEDLANWRIVRWSVTKFETAANDRLYFEEVLDNVVEDVELCAALRRSNNHEWILRHEIHGEELPRGFEYAPSEQHPTVTVYDVNRDGLEDIFVGSRWDRCYLLINRGGGKFIEVAKNVGLDIPSGAVAGVNFADMDNDGDVDVIVGRNRLPSLYFTNEKGRFTERSKELISAPMPGFVTSVSIVDYDNDGLLDVYLSTYSSIYSRVIRQQLAAGVKPRRGTMRMGDIEDSDFEELCRRLENIDNYEFYFDFPAAPNIMLRGVGGGKLERVRGPMDGPGQCFLSTFAASWCDYDDDGDPDVYLSNDFGPDKFFRNDGEGKFADISDTLPPGVRFGMGASWGDYDNDGRQDLYCSNMFTKAGNRIFSQVPTADPRLIPSLNGNTLMRNVDGRVFDMVTDRDPTVAASGWSYGSQFADVDSDGRLDVIGISGHHTTDDALSNDEDW